MTKRFQFGLVVRGQASRAKTSPDVQETWHCPPGRFPRLRLRFTKTAPTSVTRFKC